MANATDIRWTRLKSYSGSSLDEKLILSHVLPSETGMPLSRLLLLTEDYRQLFVVVRLNGLTKNENTLEPVERVYEDTPQLLLTLLARKDTPPKLFRIQGIKVFLERMTTKAACRPSPSFELGPSVCFSHPTIRAFI